MYKIEMIQSKITALLIAGALPSFGVSFADLAGWYVDNKIFMYFITIAIFFDHILGTIKHLRIDKDFTWKKNIVGLLLKMSICFMGYILFEMFYQITKDVKFIAIYLKVLLQSVTFMYPASSAFENSHVLSNGKFPSKGMMKIFRLFQDTADLSTLKPKQNESKENPDSSDIDSNNSI